MIGICAGHFIGHNCTECAEGWTGNNCQEDVDECALDIEKSLCGNGICQNKLPNDTIGFEGLGQDRGYVCFCRPGFGGQNCGKDYDECLSAPCQHNGTCKDGISSFTCACTEGFNGTYLPMSVIFILAQTLTAGIARHASSRLLRRSTVLPLLSLLFFLFK